MKAEYTKFFKCLHDVFPLKIFGMLIAFTALLFSACIHSHGPFDFNGEACIAREMSRLENLPEKDTVTTLDGQVIFLDEFYNQRFLSQPGCSLPYKFYHWLSEVKNISSKGLSGKVRHKIRAYYNLTSTCYPENREKGQIYGDVAEFYDENNAFMGFAIYLGEGRYCPRPHSGYAGSDFIEAAAFDSPTDG